MVAYTLSAGQAGFPHLWKQNVRYHIHNNLPQSHNLSQLNLERNVPQYHFHPLRSPFLSAFPLKFYAPFHRSCYLSAHLIFLIWVEEKQKFFSVLFYNIFVCPANLMLPNVIIPNFLTFWPTLKLCTKENGYNTLTKSQFEQTKLNVCRSVLDFCHRKCLARHELIYIPAGKPVILKLVLI
jgi:hypothetical protein